MVALLYMPPHDNFGLIPGDIFLACRPLPSDGNQKPSGLRQSITKMNIAASYEVIIEKHSNWKKKLEINQEM